MDADGASPAENDPLGPRFQTWVRATFWIYLAAVAAVTVMPTDVSGRPHRDSWWLVVQLVPLHVPPASFGLNIVMFMPFGVLVPLLWPRAGGIGRIAGLSLASSAVIELIQLAWWLTLGNYRTVDVNDLIANTIGGVLGLIALRLAPVL